MKTCLSCNLCSVDNERNFSDTTPGEGMVFRCDVGHWDAVHGAGVVSKETIRSYLDTAETCPDFRAEP